MSKKQASAANNAGRNVDDFRAAHDKSYIVPKKITDGLEKLGHGWEYEVEFLRRCGLSTTDLSRYRDEFEDYIVNTGGKNPKRVWAGEKELADELRLMVQ